MLESLQEDGPGCQDRIIAALREAQWNNVTTAANRGATHAPGRTARQSGSEEA